MLASITCSTCCNHFSTMPCGEIDTAGGTNCQSYLDRDRGRSPALSLEQAWGIAAFLGQYSLTNCFMLINSYLVSVSPLGSSHLLKPAASQEANEILVLMNKFLLLYFILKLCVCIHAYARICTCECKRLRGPEDDTPWNWSFTQL